MEAQKPDVGAGAGAERGPGDPRVDDPAAPQPERRPLAGRPGPPAAKRVAAGGRLLHHDGRGGVLRRLRHRRRRGAGDLHGREEAMLGTGV